jgi:glycosyltransferase involved in cell wall biosynthesis
MMVFRLSEELRRRGHLVVPVGPRKGTGWMGEMFRTAGFSPQTFWLKRPVDPTCVGRLMQLFRRHAIDVVHSHEFTMGVYGSAAARLLAIPHVLTMHGGFRATKALRRRIALRWAMRHSGNTVAVSNATRKEFAKDLGLPDGAFTVVHNGVPSTAGDAERVRREFGCTESDTVILAVGNTHNASTIACILRRAATTSTTSRPSPIYSSCRPCGRGCQWPFSKPWSQAMQLSRLQPQAYPKRS